MILNIIGNLPNFYLDRVQSLSRIQNELRKNDSRRKFTIDGNIIGDIGEVMAEKFYKIEIDKISMRRFDGNIEGDKSKLLQVKSSFIGKNFSYRKDTGLFLVLKIHLNGDIEEVYNGRNDHIQDFLVIEKGSKRQDSTTGVSYTQLKRAAKVYNGEKIELR